MDNKISEVLKTLTLEEKIHLLTGSASMATNNVIEKGVPEKRFADGPHGVRIAWYDRVIFLKFLHIVYKTF